MLDPRERTHGGACRAQNVRKRTRTDGTYGNVRTFGTRFRSLEQAELRLRSSQRGVEAARLKELGELGEAVVGEDLLRADAVDQLEKLVEVGVVGQGQGVLDAVAVDGVFL